jgi:hypothetical protein
MKIKITESQLKRIIEKYTEERMINEAWYDGVLDKIGLNFDNVKDKVKDVFKKVTGIELQDKDEVEKKDIPSEKEIEKKIEDVKTDVEKDTKEKKDKEEKTDGKIKNVIFVSGLHNRSSDEPVKKQTKRVSDNLKINADVEGYSHTDNENALRALESEPNSYVLLFSAGCAYSEKFARKLKSLNKSLNNLYVIEPHSSAKQSVTSAVKLGLPESNVWVGSYAAAGLGIVSNPTSTKKTGCDKPHWCAIDQVARQL